MTYQPSDSMLSVRDAAFHVVHSYPGGAAALATRMGLSYGVLCHKVKPNYESRHHMTLEESVKVQQLTGDHRILYAMARELDHVAIRVDSIEGDAVHADITKTVKEFADYLQSVTVAVSDDKVTDNELRDVDQQLGELINQANRLRASLAAMNQSLKSASPVSFADQVAKKKGA